MQFCTLPHTLMLIINVQANFVSKDNVSPDSAVPHSSNQVDGQKCFLVTHKTLPPHTLK